MGLITLTVNDGGKISTHYIVVITKQMGGKGHKDICSVVPTIVIFVEVQAACGATTLIDSRFWDVERIYNA